MLGYVRLFQSCTHFQCMSGSFFTTIWIKPNRSTCLKHAKATTAEENAKLAVGQTESSQNMSCQARDTASIRHVAHYFSIITLDMWGKCQLLMPKQDEARHVSVCVMETEVLRATHHTRETGAVPIHRGLYASGVDLAAQRVLDIRCCDRKCLQYNGLSLCPVTYKVTGCINAQLAVKMLFSFYVAFYIAWEKAHVVKFCKFEIR